MKPLLEKDIQKTILDYLSYKQIFHYRQNNGSFFGERNGKRWAFRAARRGVSDIVAVIDGKYHAIEVKRPGGHLSAFQQEFKKDIEAAGGKYFVAYSVEDVIEYFEGK